MNIKRKMMGKRRKRLMKKVAGIGPFIEGTLAVTPRMCGAKGCACRRGQKHMAMYLTWKEDRKTRSLYIPVERQKEAVAMNKTYKKLKKLIRTLSDIQKKILAHKEPARSDGLR